MGEVSLGDVFETPCVNDWSGECQTLSLCTAGRCMSQGRWTCEFWHRKGGSRCYTGYTRSLPFLQRASYRNKSPDPRNHHLQSKKTGSKHALMPDVGVKVFHLFYVLSCQILLHMTHVSENLPESTMISSSSAEPSSSRNTTCFPWRITVLVPGKPSSFITTASPSGSTTLSRLSDMDSGSELAGECQGCSISGSSLQVLVPGREVTLW